MNRVLAAMGFICLALPAQDLSKLPAWAREAADQAQREVAPAGADAWVVLQRKMFTYKGHGEYLVTTSRLVRILGQRGLKEGAFMVSSEGGKAQSIDSLRGWNLRPDGELVELSRRDVLTANTDDYGDFTTHTVTDATLPRLAVGSWVAFQAEETHHLPMGPITAAGVMEDIPVRRWECLTKVQQPIIGHDLAVAVHLQPRHLALWGLSPDGIKEGGLTLANLPALPEGERQHPFFGSVLPCVEVQFQDPGLREAPSFASWDTFARWTWEHWRDAIRPSGQIQALGLPPGDALRKILDWMNRELIYKQLYLTPDRGWLPVPGPEVVRRRDGDCKDHAACFLGEAAGAGIQGYPVLCAIGPGEVEQDQQPYPYIFNHVIAAVRLEESLGLAAEVETPQGRFLLVDSTDRFCPLGRLPSDHRGRRVLICTDRGAVWVDIPAGAPLVPKLEMDIQGEVKEGGLATARIRLQETGDAQGLRSAALYAGMAGLRDRTLRLMLDLPSSGAVTSLTLGDPLDLGRPFEVTFTVTCPGGLTRTQGRVQVVPWGLPGPLAAIQKSGVARVYPVEVRHKEGLHCHAVWTLPSAVGTSALPVLDAETPFRSLHFKAEAQGRNVTLDLRQELKDARFEGDQREAGVAAWKRERRLLVQLNNDGRTFRAE